MAEGTEENPDAGPGPGPEASGPARPVVRPRAVWAGTACALVGIVLLGLGMVLTTLLLLLGGVAALAAGLGVAWRGGIVNDVHATSPLKENFREIAADDVHQGHSPDEHAHDLREGEASRRRRRERADAARTTAPPLRPVGATALLVLAAWLLLGELLLSYPMTVVGQNSALRDQGLAVLVGLAGLWIRQIGFHVIPVVVAVVSGVVLVVSPWLWARSPLVEGNELVVGVLVLVAAVLTLSHEH